MNIQSNLNIKYNIHVHCTDSMHLISIRKVTDRKLQKKGKSPSKCQHDLALKFPYFDFLSKDLYNDIILLGGTIQFWKSDRILLNVKYSLFCLVWVRLMFRYCFSIPAENIPSNLEINIFSQNIYIVFGIFVVLFKHFKNLIEV